MRQGLIDSVKDIVKQEEEAAIKVHPLFNSAHEGKAVIEEELDEASFEVDMMKECFGRLWYSIKHNDKADAVNIAENLSLYGVKAACECIQVAAMANKYVESMKTKGIAAKRC